MVISKHLQWVVLAFVFIATPAVSFAQTSSFNNWWRYGNRAPWIWGQPTTTVAAGNAYSFVPSARDPDGNALTFTIRNRPAWATFSATDGRLQGTPLPANVGTYRNIIVSVSDGRRSTSLPPFAITVTAPSASPPPANTNSPPVISGVPPTSVIAGAAYSFAPTASDPDRNPLTFRISGKPAWATFDTTTGHLAGTPAVGTTGVFSDIVISVSDGVASAALRAFSITVSAPAQTNRAPTITGTPPTSAREGAQYAFAPSAADADGDSLSFTIANRPAWATFNVNTGALVGTPGAGSAGVFGSIVIAASDGKVSTPLPAFAITVAAANAAPTITGTPSRTATVGSTYSFTPSANDADRDALTFSVTNLPVWATFSASTGRLQGTPSAANVGTFGNIVIAVSDGRSSVQLPGFAIVVSQAPNAAPTISGAPPTAVMQGTSYVFQPTAADADGDVLTFSIANKPAWASFSSSTGRLQGTPAAGNVGATTGIVISVNDGKVSAALPAFTITVQAIATGSATLSWQPPTSNEDGSPLTNLAGYKVYWGTTQGTYPNSVTLNNAGLASYVVNDLVPGTYFFAVTAVSSAGAESQRSNPASKTIR
jgi:hypothetical protein